MTCFLSKLWMDLHRCILFLLRCHPEPRRIAEGWQMVDRSVYPTRACWSEYKTNMGGKLIF